MSRRTAAFSVFPASGKSLRAEDESGANGGRASRNFPARSRQSGNRRSSAGFQSGKKTGPIEKGKIADLVLIEGNSLENISEIRNAKFVIKDGRMYESARLWHSVGFQP
jgi:hypothetical protein